MSFQFLVQGFYSFTNAFVHLFPEPFLGVLSFLYQFLLARSVHNTVLAPVTFAVYMRKAKKIKSFFRSLVSSKRHYAAFVFCDFQTKFLQSFYHHPVKLLRFILVLKQAYKIIGITYHVHLALEFSFLDVFKPHIKKNLLI